MPNLNLTFYSMYLYSVLEAQFTSKNVRNESQKKFKCSLRLNKWRTTATEVGELK